MFAHRYGLRVGRHRSHQRSGFALGSKSKSGFDFSIPGKILCISEIESRPRGVETKLTLLTALQRSGHSMDVAQIKVGCVDQRAIAFFGPDFETPQRGFSESILNRAAFVSVFAVCAIALV